MAKEDTEKEEEFAKELSLLTAEKTKAEDALKTTQELASKREDAIAQLSQQKEALEKNIVEKERMIAELNQNIMEYESIVEGIREQSAKEGSETEEEFSDKLTKLSEEKSKLEIQLKAAEGLLVKRENIIELLSQQKEALEKNIAEKDGMIAELNQNIMEYESIVEGIREQSAKEGSEKEEEFAKELSLLTEKKANLKPR